MVATTTGTFYHYELPPGLSAPSARPLNAAARTAALLRDQLRQMGINPAIGETPATSVTDLGDEMVGDHRLKLIGWMIRTPDDGGQPVKIPQVTSICAAVFVENFRKVVNNVVHQ